MPPLLPLRNWTSFMPILRIFVPLAATYTVLLLPLSASLVGMLSSMKPAGQTDSAAPESMVISPCPMTRTFSTLTAPTKRSSRGGLEGLFRDGLRPKRGTATSGLERQARKLCFVEMSPVPHSSSLSTLKPRDTSLSSGVSAKSSSSSSSSSSS